MKIFRAIDDGLSACVDYTANRIFTGKFIGDIKYILASSHQLLSEYRKKVYTRAMQSKTFYTLINYLWKLWRTMMKIEILEIFFSFIFNTVKIIVTFYTEIFIVFALTFPTAILLLNWFQTSVIAFFIGLIPIILLDLLCFSALFYCIKQREESMHLSIWQSIGKIIPRFGAIGFPFLTQSTLVQEAILGFFIIAMFLGYIFEIFNINWGSNFIYWFIVVFAGFILLLGIFFFSMYMLQTYFTILLEKTTFNQAAKRSRVLLRTKLFYYLIFYLLFYICSGIFILNTTKTYFYLGLVISFYFSVIAGILMSYLLWKRFRSAPLAQDVNGTNRIPFGYVILVIFGLINYILLAVFIVKEYHPLIAIVQQQEDSYLASQEMQQYTNAAYSYTLQYPKAWTVYQWNDRSVTFYNNYTGTVTGGTWMSITVSDFDETAFDQLYEAAPGIVIDSGKTKYISTKITNLSMQGYDTVNYSIVKTTLAYPQYETHYLIHKGNLMYEIAFVSVTNDVASYNNDLFQRIINSFQFTR